MLAEDIGDNPDAVTRFILVSRPGRLPAPTGADKTTLVVPLPEDQPGALMEILDQFATRGVNLSRIESRPTGQYLGHYFFSIDADGHLADAARGRRRSRACTGISPASGSWAPIRAPTDAATVPAHNQDEAFLRRMHGWQSRALAAGPPEPVRRGLRRSFASVMLSIN